MGSWKTNIPKALTSEGPGDWQFLASPRGYPSTGTPDSKLLFQNYSMLSSVNGTGPPCNLTLPNEPTMPSSRVQAVQAL